MTEHDTSITDDTSAMVFFHYGTVVADLETAMAELSTATGITWRPITEMEMPVWTSTGADQWSVRRVYSFEGPPYVELVDDRSGLSGDGGPIGPHHIGYWSDDVKADGERLAAAGCERVLSDPGNQWFAIYRSPAGVYLELIPAMVRDAVLNT